MKTNLLTCLASLALGLGAVGQTSTPPLDSTTPAASPMPAIVSPSPALSTTPIPLVSATPSPADDLESRIEKKVRKGMHITVGDKDDTSERHHDRSDSGDDFDTGALMAIPIVGIIFSTLFGAPVLVVCVIMFFSYWKSRSLHRTVRLMVEKGQPVPEALFALPHSPARIRSDMRRGVILVMVGIGLMVFFGAASDWDGGAWAIGLIPFLIGCGYLLVWKLEGNKAGTDIPPRLP
jgi:uncharacterized protein DUF6249